jgi:CubicO group peptidase (beta-lactamase class C family)
MQVQISIEGDVRFNANLGQKNEKQENIDNSTVYRIASVSKSFSSVAIMQLM